MSLRARLIRLAHEKPELRAQLLPLLQPSEKLASVREFRTDAAAREAVALVARRVAMAALEPTHAIVSCPDCGAQLQIGIDLLQHRVAVSKMAEIPRPLLRDRNALFLFGQIAKGNSRIFAMDARPPGWVLLERLGLAEKDPERPPKGTYARLTDFGEKLFATLPK